MRVLVCGGRDYQDRERAYCELDRLEPLDGHLLIITGSANGADRLAFEWYVERRHYQGPMYFQAFPAEWRKYGKAAGPMRNQKMIDEGKPHMVVAFPGGRGTADMIRRAEAAGIPVTKIQ